MVYLEAFRFCSGIVGKSLILKNLSSLSKVPILHFKLFVPPVQKDLLLNSLALSYGRGELTLSGLARQYSDFKERLILTLRLA